jgi:hypothetical protein
MEFDFPVSRLFGEVETDCLICVDSIALRSYPFVHNVTGMFLPVTGCLGTIEKKQLELRDRVFKCEI